MTGWVSRITSVLRLRRRLDDEREALIEALVWRTEIADRVGIPREWVACPFCGKQTWAMPPHAAEPCPLVMQMAQDLGLKLDAERMTAVRAGVGIEEMARQMRKQLGEEGDDA